jgi:hypothetical protein
VGSATSRGGRRSGVFAVSATAIALLIVNTLAARPDPDLSRLPTCRRLWEDVTIAASHHLSRTPRRPLEISERPAQLLQDRFRAVVISGALALGIEPWQIWRTIEVRPSLRDRAWIVGRGNDDPGRSMVLAAGYRVVGGVAPFLVLWLGALACAPVLAWLAWELYGAHRAVAGTLLPVLVASSPFVVETLSLPYSAVGAYVLCVLVLLALTCGAALGSPSVRGLLARFALAGPFLAISVLCRGGTLLLVPGFALAAVLGAYRLPRPTKQRVAVAVTALALLLFPYVLMRQPRHHYVWSGIWEGLGDFDRSKGHAWYDPAARRAVRAAGIEVPNNLGFEHPASERMFKQLVLENVTSDPLWYAGILARRVFATIAQWKLWPYAPRDGISMSPSTTVNEGVIDVYYNMTTHVDWLGFAGRKVEIPVPGLLLPTFALATLWVAALLMPKLRLYRLQLAGPLLVICCVAVGALVLPTLITTASALETQAFGVVYLAGMAFLADTLTIATFRRAQPPAALA